MENFICEVGVTIKDVLFGETILQIPEYQRPYKWSEKNISELFNDIYDAFKDSKKEYRIGTLILHEDKEQETDKIAYKIVDGQQRIISLNLLLKALGLQVKFYVIDDSVGITKYHIYKNYVKISKLISDIDNRDNFVSYVLEQCTFVKITTKSQELAFQFFDSQNNRGRELELYDILKAYHLREIRNPEYDKGIAIRIWERAEYERLLSRLFYDVLFPIKRWTKRENGNVYPEYRRRNQWNSADKKRFFELFKGVRSNANDKFVTYHLSADRNCPQIDMPIISGEYFFEDVIRESLPGYLSLYKYVKELLHDECLKKINSDDNIHKPWKILKEWIDEGKTLKNKTLIFKRVGDGYIYDMMVSVFMFVASKFGKDSLKPPLVENICRWAWRLRDEDDKINKRDKIDKSVINKYVLGDESHKNIFTAIGDAMDIKRFLEILNDELSELTDKGEHNG